MAYSTGFDPTKRRFRMLEVGLELAFPTTLLVMRKGSRGCDSGEGNPERGLRDRMELFHKQVLEVRR